MTWARVALSARQAGQADLDELVVVQRALGFSDHPRTDAGIADQDHGLQGMGQAAQVAALFFGKLHGLDSTDFPCPSAREAAMPG